MSNSLRLAKSALTVAVAVATVFWTVGLTAFVPQPAAAASFGDLIKGETLSTVYYYGSDGQRYSFPNEKTFFTWYSDFSGVVTMSDEDLADITLAGNIVYRPGARWIKITSDDKVYAVAADGSVHWIEDEATASGLAGDSWNTFIDDVPDVFFVDYTVGDSLTDASEGYEGMLWSDGTDTYLIWDGAAREVSDAGMSANRFQSGFVLSGDGVDLDDLSSGSDLTGEESNLSDTAQMVETTTYADTQDVTVSLSSSSPSASTIVAGQGIAHMASWDFTNPTSEDVTVTSFKLKRTGVSSDTTLSSVYLFDGYVRTSDSATVSSGSVSWNDTSGLFTVPAGSTKSVAVRSNIASGTSGQTLGVQLVAAGDVGFKGSFAATGSFPQNSATHTVATVSNFATLSFASSTTPSANSSADPQDDYRVWENTVTVGNNEVVLKALRFRNIGSINADDIGNWDLYVAGVKKGSTVAEQDADGYLAFDLSSDPVTLKTGNHTIKVLADIWGGSTRTVTVGLRNAADAVAMDEDYLQPILVQANSSTFSARDAGAQTIAQGTLTFTKKSDSPSGNVTDAASAVTLASWEVKAAGEPMKIESLNFNVIDDDSDTAMTLRNGAVFVDGTQVGSTAGLCGNDTTTAGACSAVGGSGASYTTYTFGSSFIVYPGTPKTMEVRADIYDDTGTNGVAADDTIQAVIDATNLSSNVLRMTSGSYATLPGSDTTGNTLTVKQGALTVAKNGSYANQTAVAPKTPYKLASFTVTADTTEAVNLTQWDVDFTTADAADASDDLTNLYVEYGPSGDMTSTSTKATVADSDNQWSIDYTLGAGETIYVDVYADVPTSITDGDGTDDTVATALTVSATAKDSGASASAASVTGQTITWGTGSFSTSLDGSSPVAFSTAASKEIEAANYRYTAQNEDYYIKEIQVSVGTAAAAGVINMAKLYDGDTLLGSAVFAKTSGDSVAGGAALVTGLNLKVPANTHKIVTAKLLLNDVGTGAGTAASNLALALDSTKYADSQGAESTDTTDRDGNEIRAYKSIPTFTHVDLTNSTLVNGSAQDLYKFTISADSNGSVALKQLKLTVAWSDGGTADTLEVESVKLYKNGSDITDSVTIQDEDGNSVESTSGLLEADEDMVITWSTEDVVAAGSSTTYVVRGTPQQFRETGSDTVGDSVSFYLGGDSSNTQLGSDICLNDGTSVTSVVKLHDASSGACQAAAAGAANYEVIWSDNNAAGHASATNASSSADWFFGYKLKNLDLTGETWSK